MILSYEQFIDFIAFFETTNWMCPICKSHATKINLETYFRLPV